ncbi:MAG: type II 3-dehydroquinate dehydratase [Gammaproteobacteria bacterium]|nr:type II 3-dehydroquinate dehydratase [Gammaproteobacteria bacterium]
MAKILLLNGPNLNLLGQREPEVYGHETLDEVVACASDAAKALGHQLDDFQSNAEHELVDRIHQASRDGVAMIIFNPGAFTHTSVSLRDALLGVAIPFIEVHLSNVFAREDFRQHSFLTDIASGVISGLGIQGYALAVEAVHKKLSAS